MRNFGFHQFDFSIFVYPMRRKNILGRINAYSNYADNISLLGG